GLQGAIQLVEVERGFARVAGGKRGALPAAVHVGINRLELASLVVAPEFLHLDLRKRPVRRQAGKHTVGYVLDYRVGRRLGRWCRWRRRRVGRGWLGRNPLRTHSAPETVLGW